MGARWTAQSALPLVLSAHYTAQAPGGGDRLLLSGEGKRYVVQPLQPSPWVSPLDTALSLPIIKLISSLS